MADEVDVEALLEAPYNKSNDKEAPVNNDSSQSDHDDRERRHKKKKARSRSRSRSPHRRHSRSREHSSRHRSRSREKRRRSRTPDRKRRSHSRDRKRRSRSRDRRRSRSRERRRRSRSRSWDRRRRSRSREKRRRSRSRSRDRKHSKERKRMISRSPSPPFGRRPGMGARSPEPDMPSEDRDRRTVMVMQLAAKVNPKELEEFFQKVGQVRDVRMIADRKSMRSKGIAYIEFFEEASVTPALTLNGHKLFGVPIIVQPTMAEKNRLAQNAQNLKKAEGPRKLYVGSLHYNISDDMLKKIFSPFGVVDKAVIMREPDTNLSKGYGFVEFTDCDAAEKAMANLNGLELLGRQIKVNHVTDSSYTSMDILDGEDTDVGVGMTPQSRVALMAKLAEGHNAGLSIPSVPPVPILPVISACLMISNMFDPAAETGGGWDEEIRDDVLEESMRFGSVLHLQVDKFSAGNVYVKCINNQVALSVVAAFNGRFYAGRKIQAQIIPENTYHLKYPGALAAHTPLKL